ncbi:MAG TPA: FtsX-like permease family protein [Candidatus Acidoferrum sp.]|nr:FtsX-like permease family protein [Candidatus Acidoferrum sp.]
MLRRKLFRDIRRSAGAYSVCALLCAVGFLSYACMVIAAQAVITSRADYYRTTGFADCFATVLGAPKAALRQIERVDGVAAVDGRLSALATVRGLGDEDSEPELLICAIPRGELNMLSLLSGYIPAPGEDGILLSGQFSEVWGLTQGSVTIRIAGRTRTIDVAGVAESPEFVYIIRNAYDIMPDPKKYSFAFVDESLLEGMTGKSGMLTDIAFTLAPGVTFSDIEDEVRQILEPYGLSSLVDRAQHSSAAMLDSELKQIKTMVTRVPLLFVGVAGLILFITLRRLIENQRGQIGTLKSFGYSSTEVLLHYTSYGFVVGLAGGILGSIFGCLLAGQVTKLYEEYFRLPTLADAPIFSLPVVAAGTVAGALLCSAAAMLAARSVYSLRPAEALRPRPPVAAGPTPVERMPYILALFTTQGRVGLRGTFRSRRRSIATVVGVACAYMILAVMLSMYSIVDAFMFDQLELMQRQDVKVGFLRPVATADALRVARMTGVNEAETAAEAPVQLFSQQEKRDVTLMGLPDNAKLYRLLDKEGGRIGLSDDGIVLSDHLASLLGASAGDLLEMKTLYPTEKITRVRVTGIASIYMGASAYTTLKGLARMTGYGDAATMLLVKGDPAALTKLAGTLDGALAVATTESRPAMVQTYRDLLESYNGMLWVMVLLGVAVAASVIYAAGLVTFEEARRDMAILKLIGCNSKEAFEVISVEQWLVSILGMAAGVPFSMAVNNALTKAITTDVYSMPPMIEPPALLWALLLTVVALELSNLAIRKKVRRLIPAEVLKDRE